MLRRSCLFCALLASAAAAMHGAAAATSSTGSSPKLSASEIVDRNVAARGGLQTWRAVQTMVLTGKLSAGGNQRAVLPVPGRRPNSNMMPVRRAEEVQLPFRMELMRPRKMRFELQFNGETAVQVYDGTNGWKYRPFLNRRVVEPYTPEELKVASLQADLDGLLVDYATKGTKVELDSIDKVDDHDAYKLKLTLKGGSVIHLWINANTFLEDKIDGQPRRLDGVDHPVEVAYKDYREVNGVRVPFVLETKVLPIAQAAGVRAPQIPTEKITIENVSVNTKLDETLFSRAAVGEGTPGK